LNRTLLFTCIASLLFTSNSCKKEEIKPSVFSPPTIETKAITKVGRIIKSGGTIFNNGTATIASKGLCWSIHSNPTLLDSFITDTSAENYFFISLTNLLPSTTYYIRAWAVSLGNIFYGNELVVTTESLQTLLIGDNYFGGKLAYIFKPGDLGYSSDQIHGIIAASQDLTDKVSWGCYRAKADGDGWVQTMNNYSIGTGKPNTARMVGICGDIGSAANICDKLVLNGYDDWCFPSIGELQVLFNNREAIGGFTEGHYWSSTWYYDDWEPSHIWFYKGAKKFGNLPGLSSEENVRPIRYF
jgi:hypothetical protein